MLTIFLSIHTDPNMYIAIAAMIAAFVSIGGLIITIRQTRDARYLEFVNDTDEKLSEHIEKGDNVVGRDKLITYAYNYIDICERIMFLINKKKVTEDFFDYYYDFLNYGVTIMWWYTVMYDDKHPLMKTWHHMTDWVSYDQKSKPDPYPLDHLPDKMKEELPIREKEINKKDLDKTTPTEIYEQLKAKIDCHRKKM